MSANLRTGAFTEVETVANLLKCLANPQRLMIVCTLIEGERAVSELEHDLEIRQPSLSQHLASLREAGVIVGRREAKAVIYRIHDPRAAQLVEAMHKIFCEPARRRQGASVEASRTRKTPPPRTSFPQAGEAAMFARVHPTEE